MVQCGSSLSLSLEASQSLRVFGYVIGEKFQRYEAVQPGVLGLIDDTHTAATKLFNDVIMRDGLTLKGWSIGHGRSS
jgi:hypothetical protein